MVKAHVPHKNQSSTTRLSEDPKSFLFLSIMERALRNLEYICHHINYLSKNKWKIHLKRVFHPFPLQQHNTAQGIFVFVFFLSDY